MKNELRTRMSMVCANLTLLLNKIVELCDLPCQT